MHTNNHFNRTPESLQEDLADYGLNREKAIKGAGVSTDEDMKFFGVDKSKSEMKFAFDATPKQIQVRNMELAVIPDEENSFDLIAGTSFEKLKKSASFTGLRSYLSNLFDKA